VDCTGSWGDWGKCSASCGSGSQSRTYHVETQSAHGGAACVSSPQEQFCALQPCPVDCEGAWLQWGMCSTTCGAGSQSRSYAITTQAANGGSACPSSPEEQDCKVQECPVACEGSWKQWGECSKTCGPGTQSRSYNVVTRSAYGGKACPAAPEEQACNLQPCPVDCVGSWGQWGSCSAGCGTGTQSRSYTATITAANGGKACPESPEEQNCNTDPCPVDCVGAWDPWGDCSQDCGGGTQSRTYGVTTHPAHSGKPCPTTPTQQLCNIDPCPVDCDGSYGAWGPCSATCGGGEQHRTYAITKAAANGGSDCPALSQKQTCNADACPVDCAGSWGQFSLCSKTCGAGTMSRSFTVGTKTEHGGVACPASPDEQPCKLQSCPVDCAGSWGQWDKCSTTCGAGSQSRSFSITTKAAYGGVACPTTPAEQECNLAPCPVDCEGNWGQWGACSKTCGTGTQSRSYGAAVRALYGGKACPSSPEAQACKIQDCPVDCVVSWGQWGKCTNTCGGGKQSRVWYIEGEATHEAAHGGKACPAKPQEQSCNTDPCPVDCEGSWQTWACSEDCGGGTQLKTYTITTPAANGGVACPVSPQQEPCNTDPCPVDCGGNWEKWGLCSQSCGTGSQTRSFTITTDAANGGSDCPATPQEQKCNTDPCPVNCGGSFGDWSGCSTSCGPGTRSRSYGVDTKAAYGGIACPASPEVQSCPQADENFSCGPMCRGGPDDCTIPFCAGCPQCRSQEAEGSMQVPCPVDCEGSWEQWGVCSKTCGDGSQKRSFIITQAVAHGGTACPAAEEQPCKLQSCPVDCVGSWGQWDDCSKTCGDGKQSKTYSITTQPAHGGKACPASSENQGCKVQSCPVDCEVVWGQWGKCSTTCGGGTQSRTYGVTTAAAHGGKACPGSPDGQSCNTDPCPVDCEGLWQPWGDCSKNCGVGAQSRSFGVTTKAANGGAACPASPQEQSCNTDPCPVDCEGAWDSWGVCSLACGTGTQSRSFIVKTDAANGGTDCPNDQQQKCNTDPCPVDCAGSWGDWGDCSKSCATGTQSRDYSITTKAANGGKACPAPEAQDCNSDPCPVDCVGSWGQWGSCSTTCGTGTQSRSYIITTDAQHGGVAGPDLPQSQDCHLQHCPVDCVGAWDGWSACSQSCGTGTKSRTFNVVTASSHGGAACPTALEEHSCNTNSCPTTTTTTTSVSADYSKYSQFCVMFCQGEADQTTCMTSCYQMCASDSMDMCAFSSETITESTTVAPTTTASCCQEPFCPMSQGQVPNICALTECSCCPPCRFGPPPLPAVTTTTVTTTASPYKGICDMMCDGDPEQVSCHAACSEMCDSDPSMCGYGTYGSPPPTTTPAAPAAGGYDVFCNTMMGCGTDPSPASCMQMCSGICTSDPSICQMMV